MIPFDHWVADHITAMLAYWDKNQICRFANSAYGHWLGKSKEEMIDKITVKELLGPIYELNYPHIMGVLDGKVQTFEREITTPSGEIRWCLTNYFPHIVDGEVQGFIAHAVDITRTKMQEKALKESNEVITEQNKRLINFANIVSHNLRNYATGFSGITDLLIEADSKAERAKMLGHLSRLSKNFSETIGNLTEIVSVQNKDHLKFSKVNLKDYIDTVSSTLRILIQSNNVHIENAVSPGIDVEVVQSYLESILLNLMTNAIKYKDPERKPVIKMDCSEDGKNIILNISDNGKGMDMKRCKDDLFKLYKTFHGNSDAHGIGLYIVKYQVEAMGGKIDVESEVNVGTTFSLQLNKG